MKVSGQSLYISDGKIENGSYTVNSNHSLSFENHKAFNKVVFISGAILVNNPVLIIAKKTGEEYQLTNYRNFDSKNSNNEYTVDINWMEDGDFKLSVQCGQVNIISDYYTVDINEYDALIDFADADLNEYNDPNSTFYYINSKVEFCLSLTQSSEPDGLNDEFKPGNVVIYITNDKPIIAQEVKVSVIIIKGKHKQELLEEKTYQINSGDTAVSFNYYFGNKGSYLISVYTSDDVWINDGYMKIK